MIYVNRLFYFSLLLFSFLFVYFHGGKIPYMLFYTILLIPAISLIHVLVVNYFLKYKKEFNMLTAIKGNTIYFKSRFINKSLIFFPYLKILFIGMNPVCPEYSLSQDIYLVPFSQKTFKFKFDCKYRGIYKMGIKTLEIRDFFGMFKLTRKVEDMTDIIVFPKIIHLDKFHVISNYNTESNISKKNIFEDMSTVSNVREYRMGDSLKKIHWKLTSKMQDFMIKDYNNTSDINCVLLMDAEAMPYTHKDSVVIEDKVIECAVSVIHYFLSKWIKVKLLYCSDKINELEMDSPAEFKQVYSLLAGLNFSGKTGIDKMVELYSVMNITQTSIIVLTSNISYDLYDVVYKTKKNGQDISIIYVSPENLIGTKNIDVENIMSSLSSIGISVFTIDINDNIKPVLEK